MQVRFVHGDITRLDELSVGDRYTLLVDFGCFHSVPVARRDAYAAAVTKVAAPEAILWMWGLGIRPRAGVGVTADELRGPIPRLALDQRRPRIRVKSSATSPAACGWSSNPFAH
jgi:hypothetical protein